jgi:hypothetical protein
LHAGEPQVCDKLSLSAQEAFIFLAKSAGTDTLIRHWLVPVIRR